jgi:uncharacterized damage-inducible protein DinB
MTALPRDHVLRFARYNAWANGLVMDCVGRLPDPEPWRPRQAFFGSIMGTLNHGLVADRLWLARMTGEAMPWFTGLDQTLHDSVEDFRAARAATDGAIAAAMTRVPLSGTLAFHNTRGEPQSRDWAVILSHLFNHQTHHRGQIHDMLTQCGVVPPPLDLLYFPDPGPS